jgi:hypothetical protein
MGGGCHGQQLRAGGQQFTPSRANGASYAFQVSYYLTESVMTKESTIAKQSSSD